MNELPSLRLIRFSDGFGAGRLRQRQYRNSRAVASVSLDGLGAPLSLVQRNLFRPANKQIARLDLYFPMFHGKPRVDDSRVLSVVSLSLTEHFGMPSEEAQA